MDNRNVCVCVLRRGSRVDKRNVCVCVCGKDTCLENLAFQNCLNMMFAQLGGEDQTMAPSLAYQLKVAEPSKVEEKIRGLEKELGIAPGDGVSITYGRST